MCKTKRPISCFIFFISHDHDCFQHSIPHRIPVKRVAASDIAIKRETGQTVYATVLDPSSNSLSCLDLDTLRFVLRQSQSLNRNAMRISTRLTERNIIFELLGPVRFGLRIIPCGVLQDGPVDVEIVIIGAAFPRADCVEARIRQNRLILDRAWWELFMISKDRIISDGSYRRKRFPLHFPMYLPRQ